MTACPRPLQRQCVLRRYTSHTLVVASAGRFGGCTARQQPFLGRREVLNPVAGPSRQLCGDETAEREARLGDS